MFEKDKYVRELNKIQASDQFKERVIKEMKESENLKNTGKAKVLTSLRKVTTTTLAVATILVGGGFAYAKAGGKINNIPVMEYFNVRFSKDYDKYVEDEYQVVEEDGIKLTLESKLCDEGFTVLQFRVNISDERAEKMKEEVKTKYGSDLPPVLDMVSFNDKLRTDSETGVEYLFYSGMNVEPEIDNETVYLRGSSFNSITEVEQGKEYVFTQLWYLDEDKIGSKDSFKITLKDIYLEFGVDDSMVVNENGVNFYPLKGQFDVELSKERTKKDTEITEFEDVEVRNADENVSVKLSKLIETPMLNVVKLDSKNYDIKYDFFDVENYYDQFEYGVIDSYGGYIHSGLLFATNSLEFEDNSIAKADIGELYGLLEENGIATLNKTDYLTFGKSDEMQSVTIQVFKLHRADGYKKCIGEYKIDLTNNEITYSNIDDETEYLIDETYEVRYNDDDSEYMNEEYGYDFDDIHFDSEIKSVGDAQEVMEITGYDDDWNVSWTYTTSKITSTEYARLEMLYHSDDSIIFNEGGTIVSLDIKTGKVNWRNEDYKLGGTQSCFLEDRFALIGGESNNLLILDYNGKTLKHISGFEDFGMPTEIILTENTAFIKFERWNSFNQENPNTNAENFTVALDLKDNTYKVEEYYDMDEGNFVLNKNQKTYSAKVIK